DIVAGREFLGRLEKTVFISRIQNLLPFEIFLARKQEWDRLVMRVDQKQKSIVAHRLALRVHEISGVAAHQHPKATRKRRVPFLFAHFVAAGIEPHHVLDFATANAPTLKKFRATKNRMLAPQPNQFPGELEQPILFFVPLPIQPADLVVLTVSVVVALLRPTKLVAAQK